MLIPGIIFALFLGFAARAMVIGFWVRMVEGFWVRRGQDYEGVVADGWGSEEWESEEEWECMWGM